MRIRYLLKALANRLFDALRESKIKAKIQGWVDCISSKLLGISRTKLDYRFFEICWRIFVKIT